MSTKTNIKNLFNKENYKALPYIYHDRKKNQYYRVLVGTKGGTMMNAQSGWGAAGSNEFPMYTPRTWEWLFDYYDFLDSHDRNRVTHVDIPTVGVYFSGSAGDYEIFTIEKRLVEVFRAYIAPNTYQFFEIKINDDILLRVDEYIQFKIWASTDNLMTVIHLNLHLLEPIKEYEAKKLLERIF